MGRTGYTHLQDIGIAADGTTDVSAALAKLAPGHYATGGTGTYLVAADCTIPAGAVLQMFHGQLITVAAGATLTIASELIAGRYPIFDGDGKVVLNQAPETYPEWWGADNLGATSSLAALEKAVAAAPPRGTVSLQGKYLIDDTWTVARDGICVVGCGANPGNAEQQPGAEIRLAGDFHGVIFGGYEIQVENLTVYGSYAYGDLKDPRSKWPPAGKGDCIRLTGRHLWIKNVTAYRAPRYGIVITDTYGNTHFSTFINCRAEQCGSDGWMTDPEKGGLINFNTWINCRGAANRGDGMRMTLGSYQMVYSFDAELNGGYGIRLEGGGPFTNFFGGHTEANAGDADPPTYENSGVWYNVGGVQIFGGKWSDGVVDESYKKSPSPEPAPAGDAEPPTA